MDLEKGLLKEEEQSTVAKEALSKREPVWRRVFVWVWCVISVECIWLDLVLLTDPTTTQLDRITVLAFTIFTCIWAVGYCLFALLCHD